MGGLHVDRAYALRAEPECAIGGVEAGPGRSAEAAFLVAGAEGLQTSVLLEQHAPEQAVALIDHQLGRDFAPAADG
ncbi:hypothetical protein [Streptosporangium sp. NPDC000396]|uniref:hypothetical protein n=1 Tax=Streptosporangium sp. NPDC000396 TaxID=3366185 RepID=UPI0036D1C4FF